MTEVQGVVVMQNPVGFSFSQGCTELSLTSGEGAGEHYPPQGSRQVVQALGSHIDMATASAGAAEMVRKPSARLAARGSSGHAKPGAGWACGGACLHGRGGKGNPAEWFWVEEGGFPRRGAWEGPCTWG